MNAKFLIAVPEKGYKADENGFYDVKILYEGKFNHGLWGSFECTKKDLEHAAANFNGNVGTRYDESGSPELPVNYDHMGGENAGLIKSLYMQGKELWAKIEWLDDAKEKIQKKKYRYISPEFAEDWKDENGKKQGFTVLGLALTNYPFLKNKQKALELSIGPADEDRLIMTMPEDRKPQNMEDAMDEKELREKLGLKEEDDIIACIDGLLEAEGRYKEENEELRATHTSAVKALKEELDTLKAGDDSRVKALEERIDALQELASMGQEAVNKLAEKEAKEAVDAALTAGKITAAQKDAYVKLYQSDQEAFTSIIENAQPVIDLEEKGSSGEAPDADFASEAKKLADEKKISFEDAVKKLAKEKPELYKKYRESIGGK